MIFEAPRGLEETPGGSVYALALTQIHPVLLPSSGSTDDQVQ